MHPAPSIIVFTVISGLGLGLLTFLGIGFVQPTGWAAFWYFGFGYGLTLVGLAASAFHLGHPERALRAFTQWRTSWLSREAVLSAAALLFLAPHAASLVFFGAPLRGFGIVGGILALQTVLATSMIYGQLRTVPRWNHWTTMAVFLMASLTGGAILAGKVYFAQVLLSWLAVALVLHWIMGDRRFATSGSTIESATGLGTRGKVRLFEKPHTGTNYLMREMVYVVGRKHASRLRALGLIFACIVPSIMLWSAPNSLIVLGLAALAHAAGMLTTRWLFFAEAEHVVGLYYGARSAV